MCFPLFKKLYGATLTNTVSSSLLTSLASLLVKAFSSIDSNVTMRSFLAQQKYPAIIAAVVRIRPKTAEIAHIQYFFALLPVESEGSAFGDVCVILFLFEGFGDVCVILFLFEGFGDVCGVEACVWPCGGCLRSSPNSIFANRNIWEDKPL